MHISPSDPTFPEVHPVLFAAKNAQAFSRLYRDVFTHVETDPRLAPVFAVIPGSRFEDAAHRYLRDRAVTTVPWSAVSEVRPRLVVAGSPDQRLFKLGAPFMVLSHGAGNNRLRTDLSGVYGLAPEQLLHRRRWRPAAAPRTPDWLPLAGQAALAQLARDCPEALPVAEAVGDLCLERLRLSLVRRRQYRDALGLGPDQALVVVSSTWGKLSLVGRGHARLPSLLFDTLPMDRYKVAVIAHPNIEHGSGAAWSGVLSPQLANGMLMPTLDEGWRSTLIAADAVIGDSGSVTQYAAAIGIPVLLGAFGFEQMPPGGPLASFGRAAPRLDLDKPLEPQVREAIGAPQRFDFDPILRRDGSPVARIVGRAYELLDLSAPERAAPRLLPDPELIGKCRPGHTWRFTVRFDGLRARWERIPVSVPADAAGLVVARTECDDRRLLARAGVLLRHARPVPLPEARTVIAEMLEDWPHAGLVSVRVGERRFAIGTRRGLRLRLDCAPTLQDIVPAALHVWLGEQTADAAGFDAADAFVDFQSRFEPPPTLVPG